MSIHALQLPGWEESSTWGADADPATGGRYFYAQLTRNGHSDDDGPEFWVTPPQYPVYRTAAELAAAIGRVTITEPATVLRAMSAAVPSAVRRALALPEPIPEGRSEPGSGRQASLSAGRPTPNAAVPARAYLDVPYGDKDAAKAAGARWDPTARRWFDPRPPTSGLQRWAARPEVPEVLPGEDRSFGSGLFVDLVPSSCWFTNVRSCVSQQDWERLRRPVLRRAGHRCEICGAPEDRARQQWLDVHERWHYEDRSGVQTLRRLLTVCKPCHLATHFGFAQVKGREDEARAQLAAVTRQSRAQIADHVEHAFAVWDRRSRRVWELDLRILTGVGITVRPPERAADRPAAAARGLNDARSAGPDPNPGPRSPVEPAGLTMPEPAASAPRSFWGRLLGRP